MRLLFVGDVVGRPGRDALHALIGPLRCELEVDVAVVNAENSAAGRGITPGMADAMLFGGADVLTGGNHIWQHKEIGAYLAGEGRLLRPANYPRAPGRGSVRVALAGGLTLGVVHVEGRVFMRSLDCPFAAVEAEMARLGPCTAIFVDVHAEATSEKQALAWHLDGRVAGVVGTHTHVPTADARVLPAGTAYMTDAGMTGPYDSVIGMDTELAVTRFLTQRPTPHRVAEGNVALSGCLIDIDERTGLARSIERVWRPWAPPAT